MDTAKTKTSRWRRGSSILIRFGYVLLGCAIVALANAWVDAVKPGTSKRSAVKSFNLLQRGRCLDSDCSSNYIQEVIL
ncbi:hypothetical protein ACFL38_00140 [Candidatus Omnitrophota bacterium]